MKLFRVGCHHPQRYPSLFEHAAILKENVPQQPAIRWRSANQRRRRWCTWVFPDIVCENPDADSPVWSKPRRIWHGVTLNKPTVLSTGEWMLPISLDQRPGFRKFRGCFRELDPLRGANVFVSADEGATWERRGVRTFPNPDWHEHMIVEKQNGSLWMLARTRNGIMESISTDSGSTWSTLNSSHSSGSYSWTIPNTPTTEAFIKITNTSTVVIMR